MAIGAVNVAAIRPLRDRVRTISHASRTAGSSPIGPGSDLRSLVAQLHDAARQVARTGTDAQRTEAAKVIDEARRKLYLLLADGPGTAEG